MYGPSMHIGGTYVRGNALGSITVIFTFVVFFLVVMIILFGNSAHITASTEDREKLDPQYVTLSDQWYDDSAMGWISSGSLLEKGLRSFYQKTGVQPYLVITDEVNGSTSPTGDEVWDYANQVYDQMFTDEGHMVFVFQCPDGGLDYMMGAVTGAQAKTVIDDEALEILYDYVDTYFYSDYDEDEMFARAFQDAGNRIMSKTVSPVIVIVLVIGVVAVLIIVFCILKAVFKRSKEKAAETERILNTPVSSIGDQDRKSVV